MIGADGEQLGVVTPQEGIRIAQENELDLVEVAPSAIPPVCRIIDYSKFKYEQEKRAKEAKKKQKVTHLKEIKFYPKIGEHDYQVKLNHLKKFLGRGDKAKVTLYFRGREISHIDLGRRVLDRLASDLSDIAQMEASPKLEGRMLKLMFLPK